MKRILQMLCAALTLTFVLGAEAHAQWSKDPKVNTQLLDKIYWNVETEATSDGNFYMLTVSPDGDIYRVTPILHYFSKDGVELWDKPVKCKIDSTMSWTKVMTHLYVDKDDNAIVIGQTLCETQRENYTIWKVDPTGKQLWGEDGVDPHNGQCPDDQFTAAIRVTQMEAGNYIFVWMGNETVLQSISADGKVQWGEGKRIKTGAYPHVVDAGDGDMMLVYESSGLNVRRIDFEGNTVWDVKAYSGQLNSQIPSWTYVDVYPVKGGVLISYYGFLGNNEHYGYLSYIKADGTHAFSVADAGLRVGYSEYYSMTPKVVYDETNKVIYAILQERSANSQLSRRYVAQKISEEGELLWGNEGKEIIPMKNRTASYEVVAMGPDGNVMFGLMENVGNGNSESDPIDVKVAYMNPEGDFIWKDKVKTICSAASTKFDLRILPYQNEQWILVWEDNRNTSQYEGVMFGQNLYRDGSMGPDKPNIPDDDPTDPTGIEKFKAVYASALRVSPNPVYDKANITYTATQNEDVRIDLVGLNGLVVLNVFNGKMQEGENTIVWQHPSLLTPGMYLLKAASGNKVSTSKILL